MGYRLNDYEYVFDVEKGGAIFDSFKSSAKNYGNNLLNQGKAYAQKEGQRLLNQGKAYAQKKGQNLLNQGTQFLNDKINEYEGRASDYIDARTGGNLKSMLRKTSNKLINQGKAYAQREGQHLLNQGKQLAQREGQHLLNQGSNFLRDKLDEVDNRVSNYIDEKTGGKLKGIAKVLNKAGKKVGNQILNKAKQEGQRLLNEAKEQAIEQGKNALRTTVNGAFDGIGAFANNYVPGSDIAVGYLQDRANRELDKQLGSGLGRGKGSKAMKDKMARLRAMKKSNSSGGSFREPRGGSFREPRGGYIRGGAIGPDELTDNDRGLLGVTTNFVQFQNTPHFTKQRSASISGSGFLF